jgi:hypothetical protein
MRWRRSCAVVLACTACGGGTPARSADDASAAPADANESSSAPAESDPADAAPEPDRAKAGDTGTAASTEPGSPEDIREVLQLVIDDEALGPYLHLERPDRFPLRIATRNLPPGIKLEKATQPVVLVDNPDADKKPVIVFTEVDVKKDTASIRYRYDAEGIRGACTLERRDRRWILKKSRVTER